MAGGGLCILAVLSVAFQGMTTCARSSAGGMLFVSSSIGGRILPRRGQAHVCASSFKKVGSRCFGSVGRMKDANRGAAHILNSRFPSSSSDPWAHGVSLKGQWARTIHMASPSSPDMPVPQKRRDAAPLQDKLEMRVGTLNKATKKKGNVGADAASGGAKDEPGVKQRKERKAPASGGASERDGKAARFAKLIISIDGASRGNPGLASFGVCVNDETGMTVRTIRKRLGTTTCNVAEWNAAIEGLTAALELGATEVTLRSDSMLVTKQLKGEWEARTEHIAPLQRRALVLSQKFLRFDIEWVPREENQEADRLANDALDYGDRVVDLRDKSSVGFSASEPGVKESERVLSDAEGAGKRAMKRDAKGAASPADLSAKAGEEELLKLGRPALQAMAKARGLKANGTKVELVQLLMGVKAQMEQGSVGADAASGGAKDKSGVKQRKERKAPASGGASERDGETARFAKLIISIDGASRGNPGLASFGVCVKDEAGSTVRTVQKRLGTTTCNVAEWNAAIEGLTAALELGATEVTLRSDSMLVTKQLKGEWKVRTEHIAPLQRRALVLSQKFSRFDIEWVPRSKNKEADRLANDALDHGNKTINFEGIDPTCRP